MDLRRKVASYENLAVRYQILSNRTRLYGLQDSIYSWTSALNSEILFPRAPRRGDLWDFQAVFMQRWIFTALWGQVCFWVCSVFKDLYCIWFLLTSLLVPAAQKLVSEFLSNFLIKAFLILKLFKQPLSIFYLTMMMPKSNSEIKERQICSQVGNASYVK